MYIYKYSYELVLTCHQVRKQVKETIQIDHASTLMHYPVMTLASQMFKGIL